MKRGCRPWRRSLEETAALGSEEVFVAAVGQMLADECFALAVIDRCVDEIDAGVEHRIEHPSGLHLGDHGAAGRTAEFHCAEPENRDVRTGGSEGASREGHGPTVSPVAHRSPV